MRPAPPNSAVFPYTTLFRSRVRIVPTAAQALPELASGVWNLAIVNVALVDLKGPIFAILRDLAQADSQDRKSTRLNSSHPSNSYAVFCLKKKRSASQTGRT